MAKKSLTRRNQRREKLASLHKVKRENLIATLKNESATFEDRLNAQIKLSTMPRDGSRSRRRNRCALTGRPRGNLRKFGMSRIAVRELASWGQIPGLIKSSW
jgi:small subunit ribosomal protein S14